MTAIMESPCIRICRYDGVSRFCLGCGRTLAEIGGWTGFSDAERARIMAELPGRMNKINPASTS
jgi:predicted Fe-S protein YdhL (DUF1289 family)